MAHDVTFKDVHCLPFCFKFHFIKKLNRTWNLLGYFCWCLVLSIVTFVFRWFGFMSNTTYLFNRNRRMLLSLRHLWTNDWLLAPSIYLISPFNEHWSLSLMLSGDPPEVVCHPFIILLNLSFSFFTRKRRTVFALFDTLSQQCTPWYASITTPLWTNSWLPTIIPINWPLIVYCTIVRRSIRSILSVDYYALFQSLLSAKNVII